MRLFKINNSKSIYSSKNQYIISKYIPDINLKLHLEEYASRIHVIHILTARCQHKSHAVINMQYATDSSAQWQVEAV
jgi:hypothetical protein